MRLWLSFALFFVLADQLEAGRFGRSSRSSSSSSRSSSSSSRSSSSWGSRPSSSSSSRSSSSWARPSSSSSSRSSSLGSRIKNVFRRSSSSSSSRPSSGSWARSSSSSSSSYPRQSWTSSGSSSSRPSSGFGSSSSSHGTGIGGQAAPRPAQTNFGSSYPAPANRGSSVGSTLGRPGAAYPGSSGSSLGGGGFVQPRPAGGSSSSIGGGGFVQPKPGHSGSSMVGAGLAGAGVGGLAGAGAGGLASSFGSRGSGGFGSSSSGSRLGSSSSGFGSSSSFGSNSGHGTASSFGNRNRGSTFGSSSSSSSSGGRGLLGAGLAGGVLGGAAGGAGGGLASRISHAFKPNRYGTNQYQSFSKPKKSFGSYLFGGKKFGSKTPGHGTSYGTNFAGGVGQWKPKKQGVSKKMLGLGVGAGFLGGAALGVAGTMASYSVYHKYQEFKRRMHMINPMNQIGGRGWDQNYYDNNYQRNECMFGCPVNSHCEWGFCECNAGTSRRFGQCQSDWSQVPNYAPRLPTFDPFKSCISSSTCAAMDMNLICNLDVSMPGQAGTCECRRDMRWNAQEGECQFYMDVDCSSFTYDTPASAGVLSAVSRAQAAQQGGVDLVDAASLGRTETMQESLQNSLLAHVDPQSASEAEMREAFCRDIDAYSYDIEPTAPPVMAGPQQTLSLAPSRQTVVVGGQDRRGANKPARCENVPTTACAVAYDSSTCNGGWRLVIPQGEMRFRWFTATYSYRNDIDVIGVRAGCTFTGYSDSSFNGQRMTIRAEGYDRWEVLGDSAEFMHMDEDIESLQCVCRM